MNDELNGPSRDRLRLQEMIALCRPAEENDRLSWSLHIRQWANQTFQDVALNDRRLLRATRTDNNGARVSVTISRGMFEQRQVGLASMDYEAPRRFRVTDAHGTVSLYSNYADAQSAMMRTVAEAARPNVVDGLLQAQDRMLERAAHSVVKFATADAKAHDIPPEHADPHVEAESTKLAG